MTDPLLETPIDAEGKKRLFEAIDRSAEIIKAINKARTAGIDMGNQLAQATETRDKLVALKQTYFPNG